MTLVLGSSSPVETSRSKAFADRETVTVEVEGKMSELEAKQPADYAPNGYTYDSHTLASTGDGMGRMSVRCIKFNAAASFGPERTTFSVEMQEVTYDLWAHPWLGDVQDQCVKWVNDGCIAHDDKFFTKDSETGEEVEVEDDFVLDFCKAYAAGIHSFVRYFPVIEKTSVYSNPPGLSMSGKSYTGGNLKFSDKIGKFDTPPVTLEHFSSSNFFKSKDSWTEDANKTWRRVEQWTYTPEGPSSDHSWIYSEIDD